MLPGHWHERLAYVRSPGLSFFLQAIAREVGHWLLALPVLCSCPQPTRVLLAICRAHPFPWCFRCSVGWVTSPRPTRTEPAGQDGGREPGKPAQSVSEPASQDGVRESASQQYVMKVAVTLRPARTTTSCGRYGPAAFTWYVPGATKNRYVEPERTVSEATSFDPE